MTPTFSRDAQRSASARTISKFIVVTAMFVAGACCLSATASADPSTTQSSPEDLQALSQLEKPIPGANFTGTAFKDVIDFLRDAGNVNIYIDRAALNAAGMQQTTPITASESNKKLADILQDILAQQKGELKYQLQNGVIVIGSRQGFADEKISRTPDSKDPMLSDADRAIAAKLERRMPNLKFDDVGFSDVLDFMHDLTEINFDVDWKSIDTAGIDRQAKVLCRLRDVKTSTVLSFILKEAGHGKLGYRIDHGNLVISTAPN